jgi:acyl-CoA synthetase (AMP-forming)/AMP-acid ligase II
MTSEPTQGTQAASVPGLPEGGAQADFVPFPALIRTHAAAQADRPVFICAGEVLSWGELAEQVSRVGAACRAMHVEEGDKVALLATISLETLATFFGVVDAGACIVPLATSATPASILTMLRDSDAKVLVVSADMHAAIHAIESTLLHEFSGRLVAIDFALPGWLGWQDWIGTAPASLPPVALTPEQDFNLIYSSGTTGNPKGILHRHGMRYRQAARRIFSLGPESVMLLSTPIYSNTTLQPMLATLAAGGTTVLSPKFSAAGYLQLCQRYRATHTMLVPVQYQRILDCPEFAGTDLSSFVVKQCTGAPLDAGLKQRIRQSWPGKLREIYGMTEGGVSCVLDADLYPDKLGTVGKPAPNHDMRIIDDAGNVLKQGEVGEIVGRSPYMMAGYYKRPEATREIYWQDENGAVFHRSGDIGRFDADGFLTLLDRKKDMIISGGFNIYAADLEAVLAAHPHVLEATVIGIPSAQWGETPLALVVPGPGSTTSAAELLRWTNEQVGKTQRLSAVEYRKELPRSALGKVLKRELRETYWKDAASGAAASSKAPA